MGQLTLSATLVAGPPQAGDCSFPDGTTSISFATKPDPKGFSVQTGLQVQQVSSPGSYVTLAGIGAGGPVTQGTFLYIRSNGPINVRVTTAVPSAGDNVAVETICGVKVIEYAADHYLKLLEVEGQATVEWYCCGQQ